MTNPGSAVRPPQGAVSNVLIVGGGVAGMALGIGLSRSGIRSEIVEIEPQWGALGVGIALQGFALRALGQIGLLDRCIELGYGYSDFKFCDAAGNVTETVSLPRLNGPDNPASIGIMRQSIHVALQEALSAAMVPVRLGLTVEAFDEGDDGVAVRFSDGTTETYDLVVGADGAGSTVRKLLFGADCRPAYTGQAVWRATVSRPADVRCRYSFFGPHNKAGINPVSHDQMYVFLIENLPEFVRLRDDELVATMHAQLVDFGGPVASALDEIVDPAQIIYRPIRSQVLPSPWYRGRVLLVGDAAHTTTPQMASGAGIAIEDAIVLAELAASAESVPLLLESFMARRYERCRMIVENSRQLGEWEKDPSDPNADPAGLTAQSLELLNVPI